VNILKFKIFFIIFEIIEVIFLQDIIYYVSWTSLNYPEMEIVEPKLMLIISYFSFVFYLNLLNYFMEAVWFSIYITKSRKNSLEKN
jgi:hypothetical protein